MAFVSKHPATTVANLVRETGIPRTSAMHCLKVLKRENRIESHGHGQHLLITPNVQLEYSIEQAASLARPIPSQIHELLTREKALRFMEIEQALDLSPSKLRTGLQHLREAGLIGREPGHQGRFVINDATQKIDDAP